LLETGSEVHVIGKNIVDIDWWFGSDPTIYRKNRGNLIPIADEKTRNHQVLRVWPLSLLFFSSLTNQFLWYIVYYWMYNIKNWKEKRGIKGSIRLRNLWS